MQHFTVKEVAQKMRRSPRTIRDWINVGCPVPERGDVKLEAIRIGRRWLVSSDALALFAHRIRPPEAVRPPLDEEDEPSGDRRSDHASNPNQENQNAV